MEKSWRPSSSFRPGPRPRPILRRRRSSGWSMKATASPFGETRRLADPAVGFVERLADRILDPGLATRPSRTMASDLPSGAQSAHWTSSRISRGVPPPVIPMRASVPARSNGPMKWRFSADRHLAGGRDRRERRRPRVRTVGPRGCRARLDEDFDRPALPGRGVDDRLSVGSEARAEDFAALKGQLAEGRRRRRARPSCPRRRRRRRRFRRGPARASSHGQARPLRPAAAAAARPSDPSSSRPTLRRDGRARRRGRARGPSSFRTGPPGPSRGSARRATARAPALAG